jgi:hypothetical protein
VISGFANSFRSWRQALSEKPFYRLLRHCIDRIFRGGDSSGDGEMDAGIGAILAILAAPGAFVSFALSSKYGSFFLWFRAYFLNDRASLHFDPLSACLPDEYFFIVLSMVAAASIAIWKWDNLLPDRRDYANLVHLPIPSREIFSANLLAILLLTGILSVDINAGSSILFPVIATSSRGEWGYMAVFFATHLASVVLAAAFGFLGVLALLAVLMSFLPYRFFRKSSVYIRCGLAIFCVALLATSFSEPRKIEHLQYSPRPWFAFPPPAWFVGLCQSMRGLQAPLLSGLARGAILASVCAFVLAIGGYALSYRRCFLRSAETMINLPTGGGIPARVAFRILDRTILRGPFQRAGYRFVLKTLFRSEKHSLAWIGFTGIGLIVASPTVFAATSKGSPLAVVPSADLLGVPLVLTYFLMFGLRLAFELPGPLRANWTFRFGVDPGTRQSAALARRIMLTFEAPLLLLCAAAYARFWDWRVALIHTTIVAIMAVLLAETLLLGFRKIPFTCSAPPFKQTTIVALILYVVGLFAFSGVIPALESRAFDSPFPFEELIVVLLSVWGACLYAARKNQTEPERRVIFEDTLAPVVEKLDLTFHR